MKQFDMKQQMGERERDREKLYFAGKKLLFVLGQSIISFHGGCQIIKVQPD